MLGQVQSDIIISTNATCWLDIAKRMITWYYTTITHSQHVIITNRAEVMLMTIMLTFILNKC
jgi:hypothetical protein